MSTEEAPTLPSSQTHKPLLSLQQWHLDRELTRERRLPLPKKLGSLWKPDSYPFVEGNSHAFLRVNEAAYDSLCDDCKEKFSRIRYEAAEASDRNAQRAWIIAGLAFLLVILGGELAFILRH